MTYGLTAIPKSKGYKTALLKIYNQLLYLEERHLRCQEYVYLRETIDKL